MPKKMLSPRACIHVNVATFLIGFPQLSRDVRERMPASSSTTRRPICATGLDRCKVQLIRVETCHQIADRCTFQHPDDRPTGLTPHLHAESRRSYL